MSSLLRLEEALTSKKWKFEFTEESSCPKDIAEFFRTYLPHLPLASLSERLGIGGFYVNGLNVSENSTLKVPCKVEYYEPKFNLSDIAGVYPAFSKDWILFEDDFLIVLYKPRHLPSLPTKEQKVFNLKSYIEKYSAADIHMPSRLDTSTEGLVVISKNPTMHNYLQQAFEKKIIYKRYLLKSSVSTDWKHKVTKASIGKSSRHAVLREINENSGKKSLTIFSRCGKNIDNIFLARPLTGRTHQIRLHAAHLGIPILGDNFYGGGAAEMLHLLSYELSFWHPYKKDFFTFLAPLNMRPAWAKSDFN